MNLKRTFLATVAAGTIALAAAPITADASASPAVHTLNKLCRLKGGISFTAPDARARCQAADPQFGFALEELICTRVLDGTFTAVPTFMRPHRTTWSCS